MAAEPSPAPDFPFLFNNRTWIMGVLNATPDSFYAASRTMAAETALRLAADMVQEGADILDIGGESTRPGSEEVPAAEELNRILPVIDALHDRWPELPLSVDTQKSDVARQALAHGAGLINDISALHRDPQMAGVLAEAGCPVVLMHMRGTPKTMQQEPRYDDVVDDVKKFFDDRLAFAADHGIREGRIILDPGIGFGKTVEHNLMILRRLREFLSFGRPLLIGVSRKSFIGRLSATSSDHILPPEERLEGSLAAALWAVQQGARGVRVHDVGPTRRALRLWNAIGTPS
jgi:dihydropteroate synthase